MTDEKDMAKQLKYRAGDVVTLKVARLGEMALSLTLVRAILLMISCCISCTDGSGQCWR